MIDTNPTIRHAGEEKTDTVPPHPLSRRLPHPVGKWATMRKIGKFILGACGWGLAWLFSLWILMVTVGLLIFFLTGNQDISFVVKKLLFLTPWSSIAPSLDTGR